MATELKQGKDIYEFVHSTIKKAEDIGGPLTPEIRSLAEKTLVEFMEKGVLPKESLNLSPVILEKMYTYSYNLFQAGKYKDSLLIFKLLHSLDPLDSRYLFALAACHHYSKEYIKAAGDYLECVTLDPRNPLPYFYVYDCFMQTDQPLSAYFAIQACIALAKKNLQYGVLMEKAQLEANFLDTYLKQYLKEHF